MKTNKIYATLCLFSLSLLPLSAHAFNLLSGPGTIFANIVNGFVLQLTTLLMMLAIAFLTVMVVAIPIVADFGLVLGAIFLPITLAVWPITKTWATAAIGTIVSSAMVGTAAAFFISLLLKDGGAMHKAVEKANQAMVGVNGVDTIGPVMAASLGMIIFSLIAIMAAFSITGVVSRIFGGATIDGARMAAGGMIAGASAGVGAAAMSARGLEGAVRGGAAASAAAKDAGLSGKAAMQHIAGGAGRGAAAAMRSRERDAMLNRVGGVTKAMSSGGKQVAQSKNRGSDGSTGI